MRKKIEELRNREEGFTLVELLAVIVILGIIVAIAVPAIGNVTQNAETQANTAEEELIIDAARLYEIEEKTNIGDTQANGVTVDTLVKEGYLDLRADDPNTNRVVRRTNADERTNLERTYIIEDKTN